MNKFNSPLFFFFGVCLQVTLFIALAPDLFAQEFNCDVIVNDRQISGTAPASISDLEIELERYINENRWTDDQFGLNERIRCQMQIVLIGVDNQFNYSAEMIVNARRPIYNTNRETTTVLLNDTNWQFYYPPGKSLIFDRNQFDNLTSLIDYYMYIVLGYDYDSFEELGGSVFYSSALDVLELAQTSSNPGWGRITGTQRTRYGLIDDLMNPLYEDYRRSFYQYHRLGLDQFTINTENSRSEVLEALIRIRQNKDRVGRDLIFDIFFDAKYTEIVSVFMDASDSIRLEAYNLLVETDPGHTSEYERLRQ